MKCARCGGDLIVVEGRMKYILETIDGRSQRVHTSQCGGRRRTSTGAPGRPRTPGGRLKDRRVGRQGNVPALKACVTCGDTLCSPGPEASARVRWLRKRWCNELCYSLDLDKRRENDTPLINAEGLGRGTTLTARAALPDERPGHTHRFDIRAKDGVVRCYLTVNVDDKGLVKEVFLKVDRQGESVSAQADAWAINTSKLLQFGESLSEIIRNSRGRRWEPSGFVKGPIAEIHTCSSPVDYVGQYLALRYPKQLG